MSEPRVPSAPEPVSSHASGAIDRELDTRKILLVGGAIAAITVVAILLMVIVFRVLLDEEVSRDPKPAPLAAEARAQARPDPRLQVTPELDLAAMRANERAALASYAWVNRDSGRVRIPIERGMALVLEEGLPAREAGAP
jgi:hypothetical protein